MEMRNLFGKSLRIARQSRGLSQEDFSIVSSRTFVSMLERGAASPTLEKLDSLCQVLDVHPVTLLAITYWLGSEPPMSIEQLLEVVRDQLDELVSEPSASKWLQGE